MQKRLMDSEKIADILATSRTSCGKSQKFMAKALGKSIGTIQNWESGMGSPTLLNMLEWFDSLGLNPMRYMLDLLYPDTFQNLSSESSADKLREALVLYIKEAASDSEVRKLSYSIFGNTGSSWEAQLDMLTAHNHTSLRSRVNAAQTIYDSYMMEKACGNLIATDQVMPDEEQLSSAVEKGRQSVYLKKPGYVNVDISD